MEFIKRSGSKIPFDIQKIYNAVNGAFREVKGTDAPSDVKLALQTIFLAEADEYVSYHIEDVQDIVENTLMATGYYDVARSYILHRESHKESRLIQERLEYMDNYGKTNDNAASSSETDANANVAIKNVANLNGEVYKTLNRKIQRYRMRKKLKELFPECEHTYEQDIEDHIIYPHDEASTPVVENYCEAISMYPFHQYGTSTLDGLSARPPQHMSSFAGQFVNMIFLLTAQCKGAVAVGEFFNSFDYFCAKEYGEDYHLASISFVQR